MKQRITYILPEGFAVDPKDIEVTKNVLSWDTANQAAEERRLTFGLSELPPELRVFLEGFHELHIKHASSQANELFSPLVSRLSPGLHVSFTPLDPAKDTRLCRYLKSFISSKVKCSNTSASFVRPAILSARFATSSAYQFYDVTYSLKDVWTDLEALACSSTSERSPLRALCEPSVERPTPAHVDYDFDAISHALTVTILWVPKKEISASWNERKKAREVKTTGRLEVGILSPERADEPEELSMGGFLTVVGEDTHPSPTLFSFPARHHPLPHSFNASYSVAFQQPTGLHPKLDITITSISSPRPRDFCALHAYWTLPSALFIDRYQLADPLFLESQNLVSLHSLSGEQDLEAPDWAVTRWGSAALLELRTADSYIKSGSNWTITIPTHLRYINSTGSKESNAVVPVPWPVLFWACEAGEGLKMSTNPFDRVNLGYDGLFGPKTMFYHVPPMADTETLVRNLTVPTLSSEKAELVPVGTMIAVGLGFLWICWQMFGRSTPNPNQTMKKSQ